MNSEKKYGVFFFIALLLNFLPDIVPYYLESFSNGQLSVIGPLVHFEEPCSTSSKGEWFCETQYRIPKETFDTAESIGFGIVLFPIEVTCEESGKTILLDELAPDGRISYYLKNYQTIELDRIPCASDIIAKNWAKPGFSRYGYSNGPAVVGKTAWVKKTKSLVELSVLGISIAAGFIFIGFFFALQILQRVTQTTLTIPPFEPFWPFWLGFIILTSGILFGQIIPFEIPMQLEARITNFLGFVLAAGPSLFFISYNPQALPFAQTFATRLVATKRYKLFPLISLAAIFMAVSNFRMIYPFSLLFFAGLSILSSIRPRNLSVFLYGVALISDGLKILMVPGLPASRLTLTYLFILFATGMRRQIRALEKNAHFNAGTEIAAQVAHDIRAPIGALRTSFRLLSEESDEGKVARLAIDRIQTIANDILYRSRSTLDDSRSVNKIEIIELTKTLIDEKKREKRQFDIQFTENYPPYVVQACIDPQDYSRIISNLLDNAIDASYEKQIRIDVSIYRKKHFLEILVTDFGRGISPDILHILGNRQFSTKNRESNLNSGLGLYHAKQTLKRWNGILKISSTPGQITIVTLCLPHTKNN